MDREQHKQMRFKITPKLFRYITIKKQKPSCDMRRWDSMVAGVAKCYVRSGRINLCLFGNASVHVWYAAVSV